MKNAKKILALILAAAALSAILSACSKKDDKNAASKPVDAAEAAKAIVAEGDFEGALDEMNPAAVDVYYPSLPKDAKCSVYVSDSFSDEVAVFTSAELDAIETIVKAHVEEKVSLYKDYAPEQSKKAETNAAIVKKNGAVALIISNASVDDAKALAEKALG